MAVLEVLHFPDKRLRKKALPVNDIDEDIASLASDMLETMYAKSGIGLAATQVNAPQRVVVMDLSEDRNEPLFLINPEILHSEGTEQMQEGCLSVPDYYDYVERAEKVTFQYQDLEGHRHVIDADGLLAVCIQHEIDHLNGRLFIDHLSPLKRRRFLKKLEKQEKQQAQIL